MHGHRRRAILEQVVSDEGDFCERGERRHAFALVVDCALDERQWNAIGRAKREKRHQIFGCGTLLDRIVNREAKGRGEAARIGRAARCGIHKAGRFCGIGGEAHSRPLAEGSRMVERERQPPQSLSKRVSSRFIAASGAIHEKRDGLGDRQHVERNLVRPPLQSENRDVISTRAPAAGSRSAISSGDATLS